MARIVVLDSGPLGLACRPRTHPGSSAFTYWRVEMQTAGVLVVVPEIADYEVRRELIRDARSRGAGRAAIDLLDGLRDLLIYLPLNTDAVRLAAELWAESRIRGLPTADDSSLDGDVLVAAQALSFCGLDDRLTVASDNVAHLSRFVDAREWRGIKP